MTSSRLRIRPVPRCRYCHSTAKLLCGMCGRDVCEEHHEHNGTPFFSGACSPCRRFDNTMLLIQHGNLSLEECREQGLNAIIDGLSDRSDGENSDMSNMGDETKHPDGPTHSIIDVQGSDSGANSSAPSSIPETVRITVRPSRTSMTSHRPQDRVITTLRRGQPSNAEGSATLPQSVAISALSLVVANQWEKVVNGSRMMAQYIAEHAPLLRWSAAVKRLINAVKAFLSHKPATPSARKRAARIAANVISTTLLLPNKIFNPIVLWIAVRIANEIVDMPIAEGEPDGIRFIYHTLLDAVCVQWGRFGEQFLEMECVYADKKSYLGMPILPPEAQHDINWNLCCSWFIDPVSAFAEAMAPFAGAIATARQVFRPPLLQGSPVPLEFSDAYWQIRNAITAHDGPAPRPVTISLALCAALPPFASKVRHKGILNNDIRQWIINGMPIATNLRPYFPPCGHGGNVWNRVLMCHDEDCAE